jgi:hypothetical protein
MIKKVFLFSISFFSIISLAYSYELLNTEQLALGLDTYLRMDLVSFRNVVSLDSHNQDDRTTYS